MDKVREMIAFADDVVVMYESNTWPKRKNEAENDLYVVNRKFRENKLTLNMKKTKYLPLITYD